MANTKTFKQNGSPVKVKNIPSKKKFSDKLLEDPRPNKYRNMSGYKDFVRNAVTNYCSNTSKDIAFRYLYEKADIESAVRDHDYLDVPFSEYWVDRALPVSKNSAADIEIQTRSQNRSRKWFNERRWRLIASRFGEITKITTRRNKKNYRLSYI
ncbi:hypothetical protein KUTeg_020819 [Tegillarca granosa]|uniref:Uncharacterized protein n=1 Tax=Tegillarca granosa TaxID=220873 RepID=A0ABQ9ED74_TEGGR|nr:hypothetical protein KUTeg_020819 [Tegillarca granosa]